MAKHFADRVFKLVLPKRDNRERLIGSESIQKYIDKMNQTFGGTTIHNTSGCYSWQSQEGGEFDGFQCEEGIVIESALDFENKNIYKGFSRLPPKKQVEVGTEILDEKRDIVHDLADEAGSEFGQDSILVVEDVVTDVSLKKGKSRAFAKKESHEDDFLSRFI